MNFWYHFLKSMKQIRTSILCKIVQNNRKKMPKYTPENWVLFHRKLFTPTGAYILINITRKKRTIEKHFLFIYFFMLYLNHCVCVLFFFYLFGLMWFDGQNEKKQFRKFYEIGEKKPKSKKIDKKKQTQKIKSKKFYK